MLYELPSGVASAQNLKFPDAIYIRKTPIALGRLIPQGPGQGLVLGVKCKKWGNGANSSNTPKRYYQGAFGSVVAKTANRTLIKK